MDSLSQLMQLVATGITSGAVYALLGLGIVVTYSTTRVVNVAMGQFAMLGALSAISFTAAGIPLPLAAVLGVLVGIGAGVLMYQLTIRPAQARGATILTFFIIAVAVDLVFRGTGLIIWGTDAYELPPFVEGPPLNVLSAVITRQSLFVLAATVVLMVALGVLFTRTIVGKALLACAANATGARLMGISVTRMGVLAFALSSGIAAVGGILLTPDSFATYDMGLILGLKGLIGAIIGRLNNYTMTVVGCLGLGILEALSAGLLPSGYRDAVAFVVLIVVLLWQAIPALRHGVLAAEEAE